MPGSLGGHRDDPPVEVAARRLATDVGRRRPGHARARPARRRGPPAAGPATRVTNPTPPTPGRRRCPSRCCRRRRPRAPRRRLRTAAAARCAAGRRPRRAAPRPRAAPARSPVLVAGQADELGRQVGVEPVQVLPQHRGAVGGRVGGHEDHLHLLGHRRVHAAHRHRDVGHRRRAHVGAVGVTEEQQRRPALGAAR